MRNSKIIFAFLLVIIFSGLLDLTNNAYATVDVWTRGDTTTDAAGSKVMRGVSMGDALNGVAVGDSGTIIFTIDGGDNWTEAATTANVGSNSMLGVSMFDASNRVAVGDNGIIVYLDSVAPTMDSAATTSTSTIDVIFSEDLDGNTVDADGSDFAVTDHTVFSASETSAGVVEITLLTIMTSDETPTVALSGSVSDVVGNTLTSGNVLSTDGIAPTFTATSDSDTKTTVTFSEIVDGTLTFSQWTFAGNAVSAVSGQTDGATLADVTSLVFTHASTTDETPDVIYTAGDIADNAVTPNSMVGTTVTATDGIAPTATGTPLDQNSENTDGISIAEEADGVLIRVPLSTSGAVVGDSLELLLEGVAFSSALTKTLDTTDVTTNTYVEFTIPAGELAAGTNLVTATVTDIAGNEGTESAALTLTPDNTAPVFSAVGPAILSSNNDTDTVDYTLDEAVTSATGTITFTLDSLSLVSDSNSPHAFALTGSQLTATSTSISFADINIGLASNLVSGALYDITYDGTDAAGNAATTVTAVFPNMTSLSN